MRQYLKHIIIVVLLAAIVLTFHIVRRNATMRGLESTVSSDYNTTILTSHDVDSIILLSHPNLLKTDIKDIDKKSILKTLKRHPYILDADAHVTTGGKLIVNVTPHIPVVRMFYQGNEFYISRQGTCMPLSSKHYCHILVGNTMFEEPLLARPSKITLADTSIHNQPASPMKIWKLASFLHDNPKYGDVFDQVYVGEKGDLYLVPKLGTTTINIGDTTLLEQKFRNLWSFFDQGISQVGWDTYSSINLKYRGQVVCTKK